jgi:peptidoglycan/LPS O-acetylase OafA/YrhL
MSISFYSLIVACALMVYSFRKAPDRPTFLRLDQVGTLHLKGIAILLVIISHLANLNLITLPGMFRFAGAWGVAIFLIVSGFGLSQSYLKDGVGSKFLSRRFKKVLYPYAIVTGVWLLIAAFAQNTIYPVNTIALSLVGLDFKYTVDPTMWFVTFIALWYLVFYLVFRLPVHDLLRIGALFALAYALKTYSINAEPNRVLWQWTLHAYAFPIGVLIGLAYRRVSFVFSSYVMVSFLATAGAASAYVFARYVDHSLDVIDYYSRANIGFALALVAMIIIIRHFGMQSKSLAYIGAISYEIYLIEWLLMAKLDMPHMFSNTMIGVPVFLVTLFTFGAILHHILAYVINVADEFLSVNFAKKTAHVCYSRVRAWTELLHAGREELPAMPSVEKKIVNH